MVGIRGWQPSLLCSVETGFDDFGAIFEQVRSDVVCSAPSNEEQRSALVALERFRTLFEQFRSGVVGSAPSNEEQRSGLVALEQKAGVPLMESQPSVALPGRRRANYWLFAVSQSS